MPVSGVLAGQGANGRPRLVVSLATIPSRIRELAPVIDSLKEQERVPDGINVCISPFCEWEGGAYDVPGWLLDDPAVRVCVAPVDYGPANKLLGVLPLETDPTTQIVIVDDDWQCRPTLIADLAERFRPNERTAIGLSGARLPRWWSRIDVRIGSEIERSPPMPWRLTFVAEPSRELSVDILQFGFGSMVQRGWFTDDIYSMVAPLRPWFYADDVFLSGYLEQKGIGRQCLAGLRLPLPLAHAQLSPLSGEGRMRARYRAAIPALASTLGIWSASELLHPFTRMPTLGELGHWTAQALRRGRRAARKIAKRDWLQRD
ncbi:MAG: hypothetical protein WEB90_03610 [Gemmatimonadota bacterium]